MWRIVLVGLVLSGFACGGAIAQDGAKTKPDVPLEKWTGKTIMLIGAHADDDAISHGTLAMFQAHGNQVYIVTLTTGNVGTQDPKLSRRSWRISGGRRNWRRWRSWEFPRRTTSIWGMTMDCWNLRIAKLLSRIWCG